MRTFPYPLPPLGTVLLTLAAIVGVGLSLLFAAVTLPILALYRIAAARRSATRPHSRAHSRAHSRDRQTRSPSC